MARRTAEREEFLADILTTALEGGIGYWSAASAYTWTEGAAATRATIHELNDDCTDYTGATHEITIDTIATGIHRCLADGFSINSRLRDAIALGNRENDCGDIDSDAADIIIQAALLGEITYG